ncbi:WhiB family transcriptional regulator [Micromonospora harpali]|uniref:Transcriptional regulator WhiB n=1 Tax=Micromonospora harpali TaxID=1490225 RepID=A0ABW1HYG4_9ACTN
MGAQTVMDLIDEAAIPCRTDPDLWFAESPEDVEFAKALCGGCPIRQACLARALEREEPWGVWGGELVRGGPHVQRLGDAISQGGGHAGADRRRGVGEARLHRL